MGRFLAGILVAVVALAVLGQVALPRYLEGQIEERLEEGGGSSEVSLSAFPAVALLAGRGDSIEVTGTGLSFDLDDPPEEPFERLDGFGRVDVELDDAEAGPLEIERFELARDERDANYDLVVQATTTPRELASDLGSRAGGFLGGLVGSLATGAFPDGGRTPVPVELTGVIDSRDGRPETIEARGSVAGVPAGPLAEIVVGAVLDRL